MACFLISTAEALIVTALKKHSEKSEVKNTHLNPVTETEEVSVSHEMPEAGHTAHKIPFRKKLGWLSNMLWGGSALLAFEHLWHGEIIPYFPFLSAMSNSADTAEMLHEMSTVGVGMAALVTATWGIMCFVSDAIVKHHPETEEETGKEFES